MQARYELGRLLFFDPALSANYKRSCASCHRPQKAFTDQRMLARGFQFGDNLGHNTTTILNITDQQAFFHDGRAKDLDAVIESIITNPAELNTSYPIVLDRLRSSADYRDLFRRAYGGPVTSQALTSSRTVYLRSLNTTSTLFDQWQCHETLIPAAAQEGGTSCSVNRFSASPATGSPGFGMVVLTPLRPINKYEHRDCVTFSVPRHT